MMLNAKLLRIEQDGVCARGVFLADEKFVCMTLELPWRDNLPNTSCIPEGEYICKRVVSNHFGGTFEVTDVPGRSHILFHSGNRPSDSEGCILVGQSLAPGLCFIRNSRIARTTFMNTFQGVDEFTLTVTEVKDGTP